MRLTIIALFGLTLTFCKPKDRVVAHDFSKVDIEVILKDSFSIRAIAVYHDTLLGFGFNKGYGFINLKTHKTHIINFEKADPNEIKSNEIAEQRAVSFADNSFFSLGIGSPVRLRKIDFDNKQERIVYTEDHKNAFYDSLTFWNDSEGIAMGDPTDDCLSIIITRDGGDHWEKVSCANLPKTIGGEAAFAASNGNIAIVDDHTWIISGGIKSRVFYSPDKGRNWEVFETPIVQGSSTTGGYSIDFYDKENGIIYGGDYTKPEGNVANKAITTDGGRSWRLIKDGSGYKSCVRYVPNSGSKEIVAIGFTGISISNDYGQHWRELSKESFYTLRFINDSTAIAAGKGRVARLSFK